MKNTKRKKNFRFKQLLPHYFCIFAIENHQRSNHEHRADETTNSRIFQDAARAVITEINY